MVGIKNGFLCFANHHFFITWKLLLINKNKMEKAKLLTSELMVFETKDGVQLKLTGEDVQEIATRLMVKMVGTGLNYFYVQSTAVEKCKLLYQIVTEQRDKMSDEVREQYLKGILEFLKDGDIELTSLKDKVEKQKPQPNFNQ